MTTTKRTVTIAVDAEELRLLKRDLRGALDSFRYQGALDADQPTEWHHAKRLWALYERLALAYKLAGRR